MLIFFYANDVNSNTLRKLNSIIKEIIKIVFIYEFEDLIKEKTISIIATKLMES